MVGVRIAHVFDVSQTDGDPIASLEAVRPALVTGAAPPLLWDGLACQVREAGYTLSVERLPDGCNGRT